MWDVLIKRFGLERITTPQQSSWLGYQVFTLETRVRVPVGESFFASIFNLKNYNKIISFMIFLYKNIFFLIFSPKNPLFRRIIPHNERIQDTRLMGKEADQILGFLKVGTKSVKARGNSKILSAQFRISMIILFHKN